MNEIKYTLEDDGTMSINIPATAVARLVRMVVAVNSMPWTAGGLTAADLLDGFFVGDVLRALSNGGDDLAEAAADYVVGTIDTGTEDAGEDAERREELARTIELLMRRPLDPALTDAARI